MANIGETPCYYGIIPANVRYDKDLSSTAKLFYSELTCLASKEGYCFASNNYFAELYNVVPSSISNWVKQLAEKGYITVEYIYNGKECKERRIYIVEGGIQKNEQVFKKLDEGIQNFEGGYSKNTKDNNTSNNITSINNINLYNQEPEPSKPKKQKKFIPPTYDEVCAYIQEKGYNVDSKCFFDYYEATEWHDKDGNKIKNWKGKVVTWNSRNKQSFLQKNINNKNSFAEQQAKKNLQERKNYLFTEDEVE